MGKELNIWLMATSSNEEEALYRREIRKFERENEIQVRIRRLSWTSGFQELIAAFKKGDPPDVCQLGTTWVMTMAHLGYLEEVPSYIKREPLTDWMRENCIYRAKRIAVPWIIQMLGLLVRDDEVKTAGFDLKTLKSRDGFLKVCRELAAKSLSKQ